MERLDEDVCSLTGVCLARCELLSAGLATGTASGLVATAAATLAEGILGLVDEVGHGEDFLDLFEFVIVGGSLR